MIPEKHTTSNPLLVSALAFVKAGCSVVPARTDGSKAPIGSWKQYQSERASADLVASWYQSPEQTGLGIVTGTISGNLEMIELEGRAVEAGMLAQVREIAYNSGLGVIWDVLANGYVEQTPSGGIHFLYRIADEHVPGNTKLARRPGENGGVDVLAETRGEGGFVVVAPSHGAVHPSGNPWRMLRGSAETIPVLSWDERQALHDCFKALDAMPTASAVIDAISPKSDADGALTPGDDFNDRANWDDILLPLGWSKVFVSGSTTYWRRPGKDIGVSATTGRNDGDNLYVFTTSTVFEAEKPYSKWAALTHLQFGGDFRASARHLRTMGYGAIAAVVDAPSSPLASVDSISQTSQPLAPSSQSLSPNLTANLTTQTSGEGGADYEKSSWKPEPLGQYLDGTYVPVEAALLRRSDGEFLLYPGKVHSFYGESESGKSWVAQIAVVEALAMGKRVVFIDFESDAHDVVLRLKSLGATRDQILNNLRYIRPDAARDHSDPYWQQLLEPQSADLVIIDGVTEALTMWGGETKDNDAITRWVRLFPRAIASGSGACVVQIDHVTKNSESRGRFAIGGQAKLAALDGAGYLIEPIEVLAPGRVGTLSLRVTKDRPGRIRRIAGLYRKSDRTQEAAIVTVDSTRSTIQTLISVPLLEDQLRELKVNEMHTAIALFVNDHPGTGKRHILKAVKGQDSEVGDAVTQMLSEGLLSNEGQANRSVIYLTNAGREKFGVAGQGFIDEIAGVS